MNNSIDIDNARLICGNSHPDLCLEISKKTNIKMIDCDVQYFSNGEIRPVIKESIRNKDIYIVQTGTFTKINSNYSVNDFIMETYLLVCTCNRSDAKSVTLIMPTYPYSRQDKKDNPRGSISARDIARLFELSGIKRIICLDLHTAQIQGFFDIPCDNLYTHNLIKDKLDEWFIENSNSYDNDFLNNFVVISPDEGAVKKANSFASMMNLPLVVLGKERNYKEKNTVDKVSIIGDKNLLINKTAIIIDDMCDTFGTIQKASNILVENGVKDVILCVTHGIFSGPAISRMNESENVKLILCSDSIPQNVNMTLCSKLKTYSIADLLSSVVLRLIDGISISGLFDKHM